MFSTFGSRTRTRFALAAALLPAAGLAAHAQALVDPALADSASASPAASSSSLLPEAPLAPVAQNGVPQNLSQQTYPFTIQQNHSYFHTHNMSIAASATGRFQQVVTSQQPSLTSPTESVGVLAQIRATPFNGVGIEFDYGYNRYTERYYPTATGFPVTRVQQDQNEATAGYVFHFRAPIVQPFVVLGGGGIYFKAIHPTQQYGDQWRGTYMYGVGFDFVPKRSAHFSIRIQEHGLFYKAQDFYQANLRSNGYIHQAIPSAGLVYRF